MAFYDYHLHTEDMEKTAALAEMLGFSGISVVFNWTNFEDFVKIREKIVSCKKGGFDIALGMEIKDKPHRIADVAQKIRKEADLILVHGGDLEVNRAALETAEVDILLHPELGREDSGIDHTMVRLAKKNNVAIEFSMSDLIQSSRVGRARLIHSMLENAKLVKKYAAPFVLTSGAFDEWGLRSPSELTALGKVLGFQDPEIKKALSGAMLKENRKRLSGKWVMPGVEIVE